MVAVDEAVRANGFGDALVAGGLPLAEVTFRSDAAADAAWSRMLAQRASSAARTGAASGLGSDSHASAAPSAGGESRNRSQAAARSSSSASAASRDSLSCIVRAISRPAGNFASHAGLSAVCRAIAAYVCRHEASRSPGGYCAPASSERKAAAAARRSRNPICAWVSSSTNSCARASSCVHSASSSARAPSAAICFSS